MPNLEPLANRRGSARNHATCSGPAETNGVRADIRNLAETNGVRAVTEGGRHE